jgi:two-component system OmpR family sensor kinase
VVVRTAPLDPALAPGWMVRITASAAEERALRRRLLAWTFASVPALALLAVAAGWLVTGRALRPVGRMADATARIAPGSGVRLPVAEPHDELGRLGGRFNALLDRLDDALLQQRRFLADAEHELRTPVARVRTRVEAALARPPGDGDRQALEEAARELRRTSALLDELLLLARADAGTPAGPRERLYLDDVAMDAMNEWRADATRAGVTLVVDRIEEAPVVAERTLLVRAVGILLDNAIRYTPAGGRVALRVHPGPSVAVLEVSDTGIGIPLGERERVLLRFHRGAQARAMAPGGSGLGLSIAHWVVERHGGRLEILPKPGGGTLVRITLPSLARPSGVPAPDVGQVPDDEALHPAER